MDDLVGLERAKATVRRLFAKPEAAHAVLLYGPEGAGKTALASALAAQWLCPRATPEGACGECPVCQAAAAGRCVDLVWVRPQGAGGQIRLTSIDGSKPDEIDHVPVLEFIRTKPLMSRHKVVVFERADRMNASAANALLKTLEEPLPHVRMALTVVSPGQVLPTILSRCLAIACDLPAAPPEEDALALFAEGAPGRIRRLEAKRAAYERLHAFLQGLASRPSASALAAAEEFREIADDLADQDDSARAQVTDALQAMAVWARRERPGAVPAIVEAHRRVLGNASASIVLDALFLDLFEGAKT